MKRIFASLLVALFLSATTGLVFAETAAAPVTTPVAKTMKHKKAGKAGKVTKGKKVKKEKEAAPVESTTPVAK
jgi:hypothetical protein